MAYYQRRKVWAKERLYSADLNAEFDRVRDSVNTIDAEQIAAGAITADKIGAGAVGSEALADGCVTSGKIPDDAITAAKIAASAITFDKLANASLRPGKLQYYQWSGSISAGATQTLAHGLTNSSGGARTPVGIVVYERHTIGADTWHRMVTEATARFAWDSTNVYVKNASGSSKTFLVTAW